ncbi:hypothetical protein AMB3_1597 [plant metagenome]
MLHIYREARARRVRTGIHHDIYWPCGPMPSWENGGFPLGTAGAADKNFLFFVG